MQWELEKIYKNQVRGNIPPRRHLRVLGERVLGMDDPQARRPPMGEYGVGEQDDYYTIFGKTIRDESDVRKLNLKKEIENMVIKALEGESNIDIEEALRRIEKGVGYITGTHTGPVMDAKAIEAVKKLAEASGFGVDKTTNYLTRVVLPDYNVNDARLEELGKRKKDLTVLTDAFDAPIGRINLHDIVLPQLDFVEEEERVDLYNEVFAKSFEEGKVGVGDGELCLSLFTEASKGTVGDLQIPDGRNIEVKVGMGRIISARGNKFAADAKELTRLSTEKELTLKKLRSATFNTPIINKALEYTDIVERFLSKKVTDPYMRIQQMGGLMLYHYGRHGDPDSEDKEEQKKKGFDILLAVYQKGYGPTKAYGNKPRMEKGTYELATYIDVQDYDSIFNSIQEELIQFGPGGDGVYMNYPGSNQSAKFKEKWQKML